MHSCALPSRRCKDGSANAYAQILLEISSATMTTEKFATVATLTVDAGRVRCNAPFGAQANYDRTCHTKSAPKSTRIAPSIPARRYHTAQATPTNPLRETIQTQARGGTLWSPPKRIT